MLHIMWAAGTMRAHQPGMESGATPDLRFPGTVSLNKAHEPYGVACLLAASSCEI